MKKQHVIDIICVLFIILFVYAAMNKLLAFEKFRIQIGRSPLLADIAPLAAWLVPTAEIIIAIMLATLKFRLLGLYASLSLMVLFTGYIIVILNFSDYIPCSCGGVLEKLGWTEHMIFNLGFVLSALVGITLYHKQSEKKVDTFQPQIEKK